MTFENPNRAFTLDSLFQEKLREKGVIAQTAVCVLQGDSLIGCTQERICMEGIALEPVVFGPEHDPLRTELQAYVRFSPSYLFSQMPLIRWLIVLWGISVGLYIGWQYKKRAAISGSAKEETALSADVSEEKEEVRQEISFNKETGVLKSSEHEICLKKNRLRAFAYLWEAPEHRLSYSDFCEKVLERPLREDDSEEENRVWNLAIKKSMTQTISRLREDLNVFPELSIENVSNSYYLLHIGNRCPPCLKIEK